MESQKNYIEWNKLCLKEYLLYNPIYMTFWNYSGVIKLEQ